MQQFAIAGAASVRPFNPILSVQHSRKNILTGADFKQPRMKSLLEMNRPDFPGECFICELRLPDHCFRWKHNELFLLLPEEYGPAFPAIVDCYTSPPT